jgi:hypothetical protein
LIAAPAFAAQALPVEAPPIEPPHPDVAALVAKVSKDALHDDRVERRYHGERFDFPTAAVSERQLRVEYRS